LAASNAETAEIFAKPFLELPACRPSGNGKTKLGSNAAAAAGPTGAQATSYNASAMNVDVLTYSRSKGLFAGVSLEGASMDSDDDANKSLYGKAIGAKDIVAGGQAPPAAKPLDDVLTQASPARK
jgi:lipid-binding SYLF domain-containing protein